MARLRARGRSGGFALIEMVAAIAIIGAVAAPLMPALQSAREAARLGKCRDNLRQIGQALHSYAEAVGTLPQGGNGRGFSPHAMILPQLGEAALYNAINFQAEVPQWRWGCNVTAASRRLDAFLCPSDAPAPKSWLAPTCYAGNGGVPLRLPQESGIFYPGDVPPVRLADIRDGAGTTALMLEWLLGHPLPPGTAGEPRRLTFCTGFVRLKPRQLDEFVAECSSMTIVPGNYGTDKGSRWIDGSFGLSLYNHASPPNKNACTNATLVPEGAWTASSLHRGAANVLFADGGVVSIRDGIRIEVWRAIATRAGGEVVPESELRGN